MPGYTKEEDFDEFGAAREQFERIVTLLRSGENAHITHGELEQLVNLEGSEILRLLVQGHLDRRAEKEPQLDTVVGADAKQRNHRRGSSRKLMTKFGAVEVKRRSYSDRHVPALHPLDGELNLPADIYSHGMRRRVAEEVAKGSYDDTVDSVRATSAGKVSKRQAEQLAIRSAQDFDDFYVARKAAGPERTDDLLVMTVDRKGIVMLREGLREATRRKAEKAEREDRKGLSSGKKEHRKRMATVGAVYTLEGYERTAEEIMGLEEALEGPTSRAENKRVWASVEKSLEEVVDEVFQEAQRRDPDHRRPWSMLVDGDPDQLARIQGCMRRYEVDVLVVIDFIHVLSYVWKAAYCFHPRGSEEAQAWVAERALRILQGRASGVAAGMRRSATLRGLSDKEREGVDTCANYLLKYCNLMRYDWCLPHGVPIASGVIEGACRHLVKDRMEITGARWGLQGAEAVLRLRALRCSGDLDEYWRFHQGQEFKRNHLSRYEEFPLEMVA